jgi:hypothetical protein
MGGLLRGKPTLERMTGQLPKIGAVKNGFPSRRRGPRLRVVTRRESGVAMSPDDVMEYSSACMKKAPGRVRGLPHFLAGSVRTTQAVAVRNFLIVISSFARYQSASSWPFSLPLSS